MGRGKDVPETLNPLKSERKIISMIFQINGYVRQQQSILSFQSMNKLIKTRKGISRSVLFKLLNFKNEERAPCDI